MPKSYRFRTDIGVDKEVRLNISQDFDFLEILSLKLRQEDLYDRFCADYGVVAGRVVANGGYGIPNATISIFVPLDNVDENDPIISTLYPYKNLRVKNEDGYRYNLLPYVREYGGHTPTGTFPDREDILTRKEVLQVYEKYYKFTVKTNESGDFMIVGVPLGQQKLVMDLDLSNMGQFSLRPSDLIRMGMGVPSQFNGQQFKSSEDLDSLPQIVNSVREIDVTPFWGEDDLCDVGVIRADFDLRDLGIEIQPQAIFMGSIMSTTDDDYIKGNCKPKKDVGKLCDMATGPGQILSIRQTIDVDNEGKPILEEYKFQEGGNIINDEGVWMTDLPMNLDYIITNEFGEEIISLDPSVGIPTKGKYRFKIKWQNEDGLQGDILRANYLVPNIREHGWSGTTMDDAPSDEVRNKSYAFSLDWNEYYDSDSAINCEDTFYQFNFNKVYTIASHYDRFKWGFNRIKHLGIKEIDDRRCQSENNKPPINDAQRNGSLLIFLFNFLITILTPAFLSLIVLMHVLAVLYPIVRILLNIVIAIINGIIKTICLIVSVFSRRLTAEDCFSKGITPLPKDNPFKNISLPMLSYPDCEACNCKAGSVEPNDNSDLEDLASDLVFGPIVDATWTDAYVPSEGVCNNTMSPFTSKFLFSGYDNNVDDRFYEKEIKILTGEGGTRDEIEWYKSPVYPVFKNDDDPSKTRWRCQPSPTLAQALNLMNRRQMYFGDNGDQNSQPTTTNRMLVKTVNDQFGSYYHPGWTDSCFIMVLDPGTQVTPGELFTFNDPNLVVDPNVNKYPEGNQLGNNGLTGTTNVYNENGYVTVNINFVNANGDSSVATSVPIVNTGQTTSYKFKSGIEYFQVITAMTKNQVTSMVAGTTTGLLKRHFLSYRSAFLCNEDADQPGPPRPTDASDCGTHCKRITANSINGDDDLLIVFATRGVDPYTPKQKMRYDLSKIFGYNNGTGDDRFVWNGQVTVEGNYYMNIPIQPNVIDGDNETVQDSYWRNSFRTPTPHYQWKDNKLKFYDNNNYGTSYGDSNFSSKALFHPSFTAQFPSNEFESFQTSAFNKYVSLDKQLTNDNTFDNYMGDSGNGINCPDGEGDGYPATGINPWYQRRIEGCGYQYSRVNSDKRKINAEKDVITVSPLYLTRDLDDAQPVTNMTNVNRLVFRSDRLPASDKFDSNPDAQEPEFRRYALHLNLRQQLFFISEDGSVSNIEGETIGASDASGDGADAAEDATGLVSNVIASFGCEAMVPLACYQGEGEEFEVVDPCDLPGPIESDERLTNGCYNFVIRRLILTIPRDIQMFFEYRTRLRFMFAVCQGVIGQMFQNNWLNGSLYMPAFQKQTIYQSGANNENFNEVKRYKYCGDPQQPFQALRGQGPLYFNNYTNSFFYRSTPFNDGTSQFVGQEPSRDYYNGQNKLNIWYPTTIMELGPRDEFTKEISFSPEFEGYIIDTIKSSTYKDPSDIINLFIISRLANANFLEQLLNAGDGSIGQLFSRADDTAISRTLDARVDGDFAQMVSINSEYGVLPFLEGNYEDSITVSDDRFGIWFSSNTINRRVLTNGVTTFGTNPEGPTNTFGYNKTQIVPYYMWKIEDNKLFGTEFNNWQTEYIYSSGYQSDDFFNGNSTYMKPNAGYGLGYIYNRSTNDPEYDSYPVNNLNSGNFKVGSPFFFYFGLKRGKSAINQYIQKYIFLQD
jgi:hypothetical protein